MEGGLDGLIQQINVGWKQHRHRPPDIGANRRSILRIGALNVRWLKDDKIAALRELITNCDLVSDILVTTETNLKNGTGDPTIAGYALERQDRRYAKKGPDKEAQVNANAGGGILIYIRNTVNYKVRSKCEYAENNVQFVHIEITSPISLHLIAIYSPEKAHFAHVISIMSYYLAYKPDDTNVMFIGDLNIDWYVKGANDKLSQIFFNETNKKYKIRQLIKGITRGNGCIDHIHTDIPEGDVLKSGTFNSAQYGIETDHQGIYCTVNCRGKQQPQELVIHETIEQLKFTTDPMVFIQDAMKVVMDNGCVLAMFIKKNFVLYAHLSKNDTQQIITDILEKVKQVSGKQYSKSEIQCTIFTRDNTTEVFKLLQQHMWFQNWGVVWQPRQAVFKGVELEPTLTRALPAGEVQTDINALANVLGQGISTRAELVGLQNSFYRLHVCEVRQCKVLFSTERELVRHELAKHSWCVLCGEMYKSNALNNPFPGTTICKSCYCTIVKKEWNAYTQTPNICTFCPKGSCNMDVEIPGCQVKWITMCKTCYQARMSKKWKIWKLY